MTIATPFVNAGRRLIRSLRQTPGQDWLGPISSLGPVEMYRLLERFYESNGLYTYTEQALYAEGLWPQGMKPLRNPTYRAVEFYPRHLWPGPLPDALRVESDNKELAEAIDQIWAWSNWGVQKQVAARWLAMYGDLFINVASHVKNNAVDRVYFQLLRPKYVTDFDADERGILTYVRIDIPQTRREGDREEEYISTEVWTLDGYRRWEHNWADRSIDQLGTPVEEKTMEEFGIDFVPIVHCKFLDEGNDRGCACILPILDKINEMNAMVTRLHSMIWRYNKPYWAMTGAGRDKQGRPLPAPRLKNMEGERTTGTLVVEDESIMGLPGDTRLECLVPNVNYGALLEIINAQLAEIEHDLPELRYGRMIEEKAGMSGTALRLLLSDTLDRAEEVRGNALTALVRANQIAVTIAQTHNLIGKDVGMYESGSLDHTLKPRELIPVAESERAASAKVWVSTGVPLQTVLRWQGVEEEEWKLIANETNQGSLVEPGEKPEVQVAKQQATMEAFDTKLQPVIEQAVASIADMAYDYLVTKGQVAKIVEGQS
jgi:hypothetical protein